VASDGATDPQSVDEQLAAFFVQDGDDFVPRRVAQGPWGESVSGRVVGGILGRALERTAGDAGLQPTRLTVDLLRPTALKPVQVRTIVARQGRRIRLADAVLVQHDTVVARASALFLQRSEQPAGQVWSTPVQMPAPPTEPCPRDDSPIYLWSCGDHAGTLSRGNEVVDWHLGGPKFAWVRESRPLVESEPLTPFTRAALAGDVTSPLTHWGTSGLQFINADYTLTLSRLPEGPFIGLAALTHYSHGGVATGVATLLDHQGPIGSAVATALVDPGFTLPPGA
jgi:hypothetical protein